MPSLDPAAQHGAFALEVVQKLRAAGFEAYYAGGCVRDSLLGRTPKDYDVATSARPDEIRRVFAARRTLSVGAAFGVIVVVGGKGAGQIDVATFREDAAYSDGRRPDSVRFSTPEADARRRDFSINGLFFDPLGQSVLDFVDGQADLAAGLVRAIGDPAERFAEDKLRMLRAVRFAAVFAFRLHPDTLAAIRSHAAELVAVSAERIATELKLMLVDRNRAAAVELLKESHLLPVVLPEIGLPADWEGRLARLSALQEPSFPLAFAALLSGSVDAAAAESIGRRLKFSNQEIDRIVWLVRESRSLEGARFAPWPRLQPLLVSDAANELVQLNRALQQARDDDLADNTFCRLMTMLPANVLDPPPLVTGGDLSKLGIPPGPDYQRLLSAAREAQLTNQAHSKADALALIERIARSP